MSTHRSSYLLRQAPNTQTVSTKNINVGTPHYLAQERTFETKLSGPYIPCGSCVVQQYGSARAGFFLGWTMNGRCAPEALAALSGTRYTDQVSAPPTHPDTPREDAAPSLSAVLLSRAAVPHCLLTQMLPVKPTCSRRSICWSTI